ncbi:hypothetical protein [Streptomyces nitrosporeus]|uniref:hypothetical protein n=1 Tax=Streptomyces nitrosporeus TaxID=28894 RepID=UPI0039A170E0
MRGLTGAGDGGTAPVGERGPGTGRPPSSPVTRGAALTVLLAAALLCAGCSAGGTGTRDEGPAGTQPVAQVSPSSSATPMGTASPAPRVDAVRLLKNDPEVDPRVRNDLKPCAGSAYPVDTSYGTLTDNSAPDVVVNVLTCGESVGVGTYVYRRDEDGAYENVFAAEVPAVYGTIDRGDLVVTTQVYGWKDEVTFPSGEDVITYRWTGRRFAETDRVHNDFNRAVGTGEGALPLPTAQN